MRSLSARLVPSSTRAIARTRWRMPHMQSSVPLKQNIFFSAVSCFTRETSANTLRRQQHLRTRPALRRDGDERWQQIFSSSGRFSALHNPECAKLRERFGIARWRSTCPGTTSMGTSWRRCRHRRRHSRRAIDAHDRTPSATDEDRFDCNRMYRRPTNGASAHRFRRAETKKPPAFPRTASWCARRGAMSRRDQ